MTPLTFYIAGRIGADPDFFAKFAAAEAALRAEGHTVINPARNFDCRTDLPRPVYIRRDLHQIIDGDRVNAMAMLPDWDLRWLVMDGEDAGRWVDSFAVTEHAIAKALGMTVRYL